METNSTLVAPAFVGGLVGHIYPPARGRFVGGCVGVVPLNHVTGRHVGGCVGYVCEPGARRFVGGCAGAVALDLASGIRAGHAIDSAHSAVHAVGEEKAVAWPEL